jgi:WD40 repeat protein
VIHRDVKPSNLLIDSKGSIWVTDFGLARRLADPGITHHDSLLGTPRYMSPEQARTGTIDGRTDVYSLGATLYELLTLRPPFNGQTAAELIDQIGQQDPVPPTRVDRRVPRDLETVVLKALAKRPADRYNTAADLFEDLERFLNREPVKARRIGPLGRAWRVARRHPGMTAVSTAAAAIVLAIATFAYLRILSERNVAIAERDQKNDALDRVQRMTDRERASHTENLRSTIELVGLSGAPNRRSNGLELIKEASTLETDPEHRTGLRDWAVKFLVLREIEPRGPELATGKAHGLMFTPGGHRLAVLSEEEDELAFWTVDQPRLLTKLSLRGGAGSLPQPVADSGFMESSAGVRPDPAGANAAAPAATALRSGSGAGSTASPGRTNPPWVPRQKLAQIGQYVAAVLPDDKGLGLIDLLSGSPLRILNPPDHKIIGVVGEATGRRLVTIELVQDDSMLQGLLDGMPVQDTPFNRPEFQVYLWDPDHLDRPIASLPWRAGRRDPGAYPLVAISPDGRTVAVAPVRGMVARLFSAQDGKPLRRNEIEPQAELWALALGPNNTLATAGNTSGGVAIRVWNLDSLFPATLTPPMQTYTRLMRFSPQGNLLAIMGSGPIELWDPAAHILVAVLGTSDQATDLAFTPDGKTLAALSRTGDSMLWTVRDSAARTQLSGFDTSPASLAFSDGGVLAVVSWNGDIWSWRSGRCPEIESRAALGAAAGSSGPTTEPKHPDASPGTDGTLRGARGRREGTRPPRQRPMGPPASVAFDASGRMVLHDAQGLKVYAEDAKSSEDPPAFRLTTPPPQGFGPLRATALARTADGQMMALIRGSSIYLWHAEYPEELIPLELPRRSPANVSDTPGPVFWSIQISPHGERIYAIEHKGTTGLLRAWAIENGPDPKSARARELNLAPVPDGASRLALRPDGHVLAVEDRNGKITLLDALGHAVLGTVLPRGAQTDLLLAPLAFSPDGRELAVGSQQGTISLWSVAQPSRPRLRLNLPGHRGRVTQLAYDPRGGRLASATTDSIVEVWDLDVIASELLRLKLSD